VAVWTFNGAELRPIEPPQAGAEFEVCEVASLRSALSRARTVVNVGKLSPNLAALLIPGAPPCCSVEKPWAPVSAASLISSSLNASQTGAVAGLHGGGAVGLVQGPPGTGKSALIAQVVLNCVPVGMRVLCCTATNHAIDSLVTKLEAAGVRELVCVGSAEAMGAAARRHTVTARLMRDPVVIQADAALAAATKDREAADQVLARLAKPGGGASKKKGADGREVNRGFVERTMNKLDANDARRPVKRTPGVTRLLDMIGLKFREGMLAAEVVKASRAYLSGEITGPGGGGGNSEDAALLDARRHAKRAMAAAVGREAAIRGEVECLRSRAARRMWARARVVACTASSAVDVNARLTRDLAEHDDDDDEGEAGFYVGGAVGGGSNDENGEDTAITFPYVILDEAGAMLEPDSMGTLLHGALGCLLCGDHHQLPPFTALPEHSLAVRRDGYTMSLLERLATENSGGRSEGGAVMLREQYRMPRDLASTVSNLFYGGVLRTPAALYRMHPLPSCFVACQHGCEARPRKGKGASFENHGEAEACVAIASTAVEHCGHAPNDVVVITFYGGQRALVAAKLAAVGLSGVSVVTVDAMQGREAEVVILSCVRTGEGGLGFLSDSRRICVALSRARETLVVVGEPRALRRNRIWAAVLNDLHNFPTHRAYTSELSHAVPAGWAQGLQRGPNEGRAAAAVASEVAVSIDASIEALRRLRNLQNAHPLLLPHQPLLSPPQAPEEALRSLSITIDGKAKVEERSSSESKADANAEKAVAKLEKKAAKKRGGGGAKKADSAAVALLRRSAEWGGEGGLLPRLADDCKRLRQIVKTDIQKRELVDGVVNLVEDGCALGGGARGAASGRGVLAKLLKVLYDGDVIEEEHLFAWVDRGGAPEWALAAAAPFVTWLRQAEEGSSSSGDSDNE